MDLMVGSQLAAFCRERDLGSLSEPDAFETFAGFCVLNTFYEDEFAPDTFRMGGGNDLGVDVFGIVVNNELYRDAADVREVVAQARNLVVDVVLVQAKTSEKFEGKVVSDLADNLRHLLDPADLPYEASPDVENIRECLRLVYADIGKFADRLPRLHVHYVSTGKQVARLIAQKAESAKRRLAAMGRFESVDFHCVTGPELRELYKRATTAVSATFRMPKRVTLPEIPGVDQSFQGLLSADELVRRVLTDSGGGIRKSVFHGNVRDFQGYNQVNDQIRQTLRHPTRKRQFAVLNNGVTIVARDLKPVGDELRIGDFQIVNGCQTCHVLFDHRGELTEDVQVRVSIVHSQDEEVIRGIVAATNRQTSISEEDLSSREEFHKQLEDYFAAQEGGRRLFYERRSKQYSEKPEVEKTRVISRTHLTKAYLAMFLDEAAGVGNYRPLLESRKGELFQPEQPLVAYYTAAAAHYRLEWLIRNGRLPTEFRAAGYHLLAGMRTRLLRAGAIGSMNEKTAERECAKLLAVLWDASAAEKLVLDLLPPLRRAIAAEPTPDLPLGRVVRTQRFADRMRREVLGRSATAEPAGAGHRVR